MQVHTLAALLAFSVASLSGQSPAPPSAPPPDPTGAISGVVVEGLSDEPVENATVTIQGSATTGMLQTRQFTDAKGRFVFANLKPGLDYTLTANAPGFFAGGFSRDSGPSDQRASIPLKADEWVRDVRVTVWKPGAISGRIVDEAGEPVVGVYVRVIARMPIAGRDQLVAGPYGISDDRGFYRIAGLDAGRYLVEVPSIQTAPSPTATPTGSVTYLGLNGRYPWAPAPRADGRPRAYPITFFPGARGVTEATAVEVALAEERSGVDISLEPVPVFTVSGALQGPAEGLTLRLMPAGLEALGSGSEAAGATVAADGSFTFTGVPAGAYVIDVRRRVGEFVMLQAGSTRRLPIAQSATSWAAFSTAVQSAPTGLSLLETQYGSNQNASSAQARLAIAVGTTDVSGLVVPLRAGGTMEGRIEFEMANGAADAKPQYYQSSLSLDPASGQPDLGSPVAQLSPDAFRFDGLRSGEYFLRVRGIKGWTLKSVAWNGDDYTNRPFDGAATNAFSGVVLTLTNRVATIAGTVKEKAAAVILFPTDQVAWSNFGFNPALIRTTFTAPDGSYRFDALPAGDYYVIAVEPGRRQAWLEAGFFARMAPLASRVAPGWGDTETANLSIVVTRR
jgi:hypothetical protein